MIVLVPLAIIVGVACFWAPSAFARLTHPDRHATQWDREMDAAMIAAVAAVAVFWGGGYLLFGGWP